MRKAAKRLIVSLAVLCALFAMAVVLTSRPGDRVLYPPPAGAAQTVIHVVSHGYHSGLALPRDVVGRLAAQRGHGALIAVSTRFAGYPWIEVGWGDEGFYRSVPTAASLTVGLALRALFLPGNASVLHVVGLGEQPQIVFRGSDVVPVAVSEAGLARLIALLEASFAQRADGLPPDDLGPGLYGASLFFRGDGSFHLFRVCNHWVADLLTAAGVPTSLALATLPPGLLLDLRWRSGLRPLPRT
jgi:uncharacterized protein (TIGR02117 family)